MDLQDIGSVGEIVAAIATVATLIYLAIQIRQNTIEQRNSSRMATTRLITDWHTVVMSDSELVRIFSAGFLEPDKLESSDRARFIWIVAAFASRIEEMSTQYKAGLIEPELWGQYRATMASFLVNPILKEWWDSRVFVCSEEFYYEIDSSAIDNEVWSADRMNVIVKSPNAS